jgi:hypothetical protein
MSRIVLLLLTILVSCSKPQSDAIDAARPPGLHALLLNGGSTRERNYYSHVENLRRMMVLLDSRDVPPNRIDVFSSDGSDEAADLATRDGRSQGEIWRLPRKEVASLLRPPVVFVDTTLDGHPVRPATQEALRAWFDSTGAGLIPGDTLLLYVTDHGEPNRADPRNAAISLWHDRLTVEQLGEMLALLDPGVRVVLLMSQCFSGSFANLALSDFGDPSRPRALCGFFAATASRTSSGCYPETSGKQRLGYTHRVLESLGRQGSLRVADREARLTDRTPDVPHASSDFHLEQLLAGAATARGVERDDFADQQLSLAWGVVPVMIPHLKHYDPMWNLAKTELLRRGMAIKDSRVVVTCGIPFDEPGTTNLLKVETV